MADELFAVRWVGPDEEGGPAVRLLDQTALPGRSEVLDCADVATLAEAIRSLRVRGAPALGVAGAYGVVLGALVDGDADKAAAFLSAQRPTAVNLSWACRLVAAAGADVDAQLAEARRIDAANSAACTAMGRHGADWLRERCGGGPLRLQTHCNTGMLACQGIGTAFGVAHTVHDDGRLAQLWVDETRPLLQGARLTAFEAATLGMPHAVVPDAAAAALMSAGDVDAVVVGADRIAANGDTANKIGTLTLAVVAARYGVPFLVVAPVSTIDFATSTGADIEIEERDPDEVRTALGALRLAPESSPAHNPAFDVTPAELITAIVTELGVVEPPYATGIAGLR
ncbi:S-methyl-5-thioribose-1-phosphate isomerase [soil metagenome]